MSFTRPATMPFNRPPRIHASLPVETLEIPTPPAPLTAPGVLNWITMLLPVSTMVLMVTMTIYTSGPTSLARSILLLSPMMLIGALGTGLTYAWQRRRYKRKLAQARQDYAAALRRIEARLLSLQKRQQRLLCEIHPDALECLQRAQDQDARLGERRPEDPDFLVLRLGVGAVASSITLKAPDAKARPAEFEQELALAEGLYQTYSKLADAPVTAHIGRIGSIGIAGERHAVLNTARALVGHLITHHWFSEVRVAAVCSPANAGDWAWMQSLPHATTTLPWQAAASPRGDEPPAELLTALEAELQRREQWAEARQESAAPPLPRLMIVFDDLPGDYAHPGLTLLHQTGRKLGLHGIFLTDNPRQIPGECGAIIEVEKNRLTYRESGPGGRRLDCRPDELGPQQAWALARALAAIAWPRSEDVAQPPALVNFLELFGVSRVEDLPFESWWDGGNPSGHLRVPIGKTSATAALIFDLNDRDGAHGPHGLIGGMTGSGKSEVLKTFILALAVTHHPYDLNFALVDYKGGAAFNELARLPHTVGIITDIEGHAAYAERVLLALAGEIEHRKRVIEQARRAFEFGRSHIEDYRQLAVKRPLPHLVIVFDEFAEFKQRHPAESKRLILIARQGRSLGVHLVLATQNIAAAVDPEILQNSTFRICLRVAEAVDSNQMIGIPDAIHLTRGRAYFRAQTRQLVQVAYSGGSYRSSNGEPSSARTLVRIRPDGQRENIFFPTTGGEDDQGEHAPTQASAVVDHLVETARRLRLKKPPAIWPDPLPERVYLPELVSKHATGGWDGTDWHPCRPWAARPGSSSSPGTRVPDHDGQAARPGSSSSTVVHPILGLYDHPAQQGQFIFQIDPEQGGGHLLIFGSAGSGKSTLLRTLVTCLARTRRPDEAHVYVLDLGGQSALKALEVLPHVGAVVTRIETERAERLIQFIHAEVSRRNDLCRAARVDSWMDYNAQASPAARLPALYFIIDGFGDFKQAFPPEAVRGIVGLGGGLASGLSLVVASNLQSDVPNDLFANIPQRLSFNQADQAEYFRIVGPLSEAKKKEEAGKAPPGRGLLRGNPPLEFQAALPTAGASDREQADHLAELAQKMKQAWEGPTPREIRSLPLLVPMSEIEASRPVVALGRRMPLFTALGQDYATLAPAGLALDEDGPAFLVAGVTPQSGKTVLLQTWVVGLAARFTESEVRFIFLDFHSHALAVFRRLPHKLDYAGTRAEMDSSLARLAEEVKRRQEELEQAYAAQPESFDGRAHLSRWPHLLVVVDDYHSLAAKLDNEKKLLADCLAKGGDVGLSFVIAGNVSELPRDFDDALMQRVRKSGCGALLGGADGMDQFNNARRPAGQPAVGLPPGRGYLIKRGQARLFQAAAYWREGEDPAQALAQRMERITLRHTHPHDSHSC